MARKTFEYVVTDEGRDKGKVFLLTEMPCEQAETWAMRALFALMNGNIDLPDNFAVLGMAGMAQMGLKALGSLKWEVAAPLLAEMLECVEYYPDPKNKKTRLRSDLWASQVEEVSTRLKLRLEVFQLHVGFLQAAVQSASENITAAVKRTPQPSMPTSQG